MIVIMTFAIEKKYLQYKYKLTCIMETLKSALILLRNVVPSQVFI